MEKQGSRSLDTTEKLVLRKTAIRMIKQGVKKKDVVSQFGVNKNTVTNWWRSYREHGHGSDHYAKSGVRSEDKKLLTDQQEEAIQRMIVDRMLDQAFNICERIHQKVCIFGDYNHQLYDREDLEGKNREEDGFWEGHRGHWASPGGEDHFAAANAPRY